MDKETFNIGGLVGAEPEAPAAAIPAKTNATIGETAPVSVAQNGNSSFLECSCGWVCPGDTPLPCCECGKLVQPGVTLKAYLENPKLYDALTITELGKQIEGEEKTRRAIFLFSCIRLVKNRGKGAASNLLVNSASSAGKSYITGAICELHPEGEVESLARASAATFSYWKANKEGFSWDGKICRLTDIPDALLKSDAFKTFLSDADKSVIVNKNAKGTTEAVEYAVKGKPIVIACTASAEPNDEILNRFNLVELDESAEQTKAITRRQLREAAGKGQSINYSITATAALGSLQPVDVIIPYAEALAEHLPSEVRARRDVPRILNLIRASAALHQFQRERDELGKVIASGADYEIAREALQQIKTGAFVALTRSQKRAYDACIEHSKACGLVGFTAREFLAAKPICRQTQVYDLLGKLAEKGLLLTQLEHREGAFKPVLTYKPVDAATLHSISLPPFEALLEKPKLPKNTELPLLKLTEITEIAENAKSNFGNSSNSVLIIDTKPVKLRQAVPSLGAAGAIVKLQPELAKDYLAAGIAEEVAFA